MKAFNIFSIHHKISVSIAIMLTLMFVMPVGDPTAVAQNPLVDPHGIALDVAGGKMYWTDDSADRIQRANLDGSNVENLITQGLSDPYGIALDVVNGKMYWADEGANRIQRANLDGSNVETLVSRGLDDPHDIALDVAGGKMYWTDDSADRIQRANLDGSNIETLLRRTRINFWGNTTGRGDPYGIALDVANGKMYWADEGENEILRANLDGSNIQILVARGLDDPHGIALDVAGGKMYWTDDSADRIQRANLDGSNVENLITQGLSDPYGIALDVANGKMYWADEGANRIQRANLDGSLIETLIPRESSLAADAISASAAPLLTETTLDEGVVTLTLSYDTYEADVATIRDAVTVSGINGVTIDTATVQRLSDTEITVELDFARTNLDTDATLTFSVAADAISDYTGSAFTAEILVPAVKLISASAAPLLTETTLDEGVVTLTLSYDTYESDVVTIRDAVTVSGIKGVTVDATTIQRLSDTEITVELDFDGTDFDTDSTLTFSVEAGAITNYTGSAFITEEIAVTAHKESLSASVASPLTEGTLNGSPVTLLLTGAAFEQDISKIRDGVTVSGINGVTVDTATVQRLSDRKITVALDFDGTDFNRKSALTFSVASGAITNYKGTALTTEIPVTVNREEALWEIFWTDSGTDKIQRANLDGSDVQDLVTRTQGLETPNGIALDVAGGKMYWIDAGTDKIQRANLDGSNVQDLVTRLGRPNGIALDVEGGKMYWTDWGTAKIQRANLDGSDVQDLVTQGLKRPDSVALDVAGGKMYWTDWGTDKIQRANLDGSDVQDLVTQRLESPNGIALDVEGGKMYWTDSGTDKIQRANLDGSNIEDVVKGLRNPNGIAIGIFSSVNLTIVVEDANRDGVVDVQDIVYIGQRYGQSGQSSADVNKDGVVNIDDLILVAAVIDNAPAAPSLRSQIPKGLTAAVVNQWLTEAKLTPQNTLAYQRGVRFLEQLLVALTPKETALLANYPNPFNPETWIPYHLSKDADVTLHIYAVNGTLVRTLPLGHQPAGMYQSRSRGAYWDGKNKFGEPVASGVYFYTLTAGDFTATRKMLIRK